MPSPENCVRFYYSFRSPYAWLAAERIEQELGDLDVAIERVPIYPKPGEFPNDPVATPNKVAYLLQDVPRVARAQGLTVRFPSAVDADWALSHAAALRAEELGAGHAFVIAAFRQRWMEGRDLGDDAVIGDAAEAAGVERGEILAGAHSAELQARVASSWERAMHGDKIFGVPSFVFAERLYWGQDRLPYLRDAIERKLAAA